MNPNLVPAVSFGYKDLLLRKLNYSVTCSVLSQLVVLQLYVFAANINLLHPLEWVMTSLRTFVSFSTWLFIIPFVTITLAQSIICAKDYIFKATFRSTRFQKIISVFSIHNFILLMLHVIVGALLVWIFLSLAPVPRNNLTTICRERYYCLVESTLFLLLGGLWTGLYFFIKVYMSGKQLLFPVVHQRKVLQLKSAILPMLKMCIISSFWPSLYYAVLYYFWGNQVSNNFKSFFGLLPEESSDGVLIYLYLWMFSALYFFSMNLMRFFFNLFLTEPVQFPLQKHSDNVLTLQESINMSNLPIIQNLACLDLYRLAQWNKLRRQVFFTLSQPGGHPHNWNILVENILKLFNEYIVLLNKSTETDIVLKAQVAPNILKSPFMSSDKYVNLRNMSLNLCDTSLLDVTNVSHNVPGLVISETMTSKLKQKVLNAWSMMKVFLGINFFFGELPQANIQKCLANGQQIIWTSQGVSDLACASLLEDRYGIVQKDLPVMITTLVQLKQALDKLNKVPALTRKIAGYDDFNYKMKGAITLAVKRSLFNICRVFGSYMNELPLSKEVVQHLQTFIICKS